MIRLVPMKKKDFESFMEISMKDQMQGQVRAGVWSAEEAPANMDKLRRQMLPDGISTPGHHFFSVEEPASGDMIGALWYMIVEDEGDRQVFVFDIQIDNDHRRHGYGSQVFKAMEEDVKTQGINTISLHVFEDNLPARAMYKKLGYHGTTTMLSKKLG